MSSQHRWPTLFLFFTLPVLLSLPCTASPHEKTKPGALQGEIRLTGGSLRPEQVLIQLQRRGTTIGSAFADDRGRFTFLNLGDDVYHLVINVEGYAPVDQEVQVRQDSPLSSVRIVLTPLENTKTQAHPDRAPGANPHAVDAADYTKPFPGEAIKEFQAGVLAEQKGKADKAIGHYEKAIRLAPDFYPARNNLGTIYLGRGDFAAAEREFLHVTRLNQSDAQAYFNLGNVFLLTKRYEEAFRALQEGFNRDPRSALGNYLLGALHLRLGNPTEAEPYLRTALELDPGMARVHLELASLYLQQGRTTEAIARMKSFAEKSPRDPLVPKIKDMIRRLEESSRASG